MQAEQIRQELESVRQIAQRNSEAGEANADDLLVEWTRKAMLEKLARARAKGRGGWWDENRCEIDYLRDLLQEHVKKGDMIDVINIAAMIHVRETAARAEP